MQYIFYAVLLIGLLIRLGYALSQDHLIVYTGQLGGDEAYYLANGWGLLSGQEHGYARGISFYISQLPTAPLYLLFVGLPQVLLPDAAAVIAIRVVQCLLGSATAYLAYRTASRLVRDPRAGAVAGIALSLHPAFIVDASRIATETLYIFFVALALWMYVCRVLDPAHFRMRGATYLVLAGVFLGLGTLTRAVLLLFPFGLALHLLLVTGRRRGPERAALLLTVYIAVVGIWTMVNLLAWDRFIVASDQFLPALWRGAITADGSPQQNDALLIDPEDRDPTCEADCGRLVDPSTYVEQTSAAVTGDPLGFVRLRASELALANIQPHGTVELGGESLRALAAQWLRDGLPLEGLLRLVTGEQFVPKAMIYLFHYVGVIGGLAGAWLLRHDRRWMPPLLLFVLYTELLHLVVLALPRYIFPAQYALWVLAGPALLHLYDRFQHSHFNHSRANHSRANRSYPGQLPDDDRGALSANTPR